MPNFIIVHTTHEGCYNSDETIPARINTPKIFFFTDKEKAHDFFNEYVHNVGDLDIRCINGNYLSHIENCTCGIVEMKDDTPVLFFNKLNQVFFLENNGVLFSTPSEVKTEINGMNIIHKIVTNNCKNLNAVQREEYIKIGRVCEFYKKKMMQKCKEEKCKEEKCKSKDKKATKDKKSKVKKVVSSDEEDDDDSDEDETLIKKTNEELNLNSDEDEK